MVGCRVLAEHSPRGVFERSGDDDEGSAHLRGARLHGERRAGAIRDYGPWTDAVRVEAAGGDPAFNGSSLDGCPFISRDGKTFYMASNRPGGLGGIDIWVSHRAGPDEPWGAPVNVGAPVNSPAN